MDSGAVLVHAAYATPDATGYCSDEDFIYRMPSGVLLPRPDDFDGSSGWHLRELARVLTYGSTIPSQPCKRAGSTLTTDNNETPATPDPGTYLSFWGEMIGNLTFQASWILERFALFTDPAAPGLIFAGQAFLDEIRQVTGDSSITQVVELPLAPVYQSPVATPGGSQAVDPRQMES